MRAKLREAWFLYLKFFVRILAYIIFPLKIINKKKILKKQKCLYVSNHLSWIDAVYFFFQAPGRPYMVAKKEIRKNWFVRLVEKMCDIIYIDRENPEIAEIKKILDYLKRDRVISIFPEGTRNKQNRELQPLKSGATVFAIKTKAPIQSVMIYKKGKAFKKNYLFVGEPFYLEEFYGQKMTPELTEKADEIVRKNMLDTMEKMDYYIANKLWKKKNRLKHQEYINQPQE